MEPVENRLFDLMENFTFEALSEDDRLFVLSNMTEEAFRAQQKIFAATDQLEYPNAIPLPLALPSKKGALLMTPIPLYKSLIGAAAAALLVFFFWPKNSSQEKIVYVDKPYTSDTIYKMKIVYDTVFKVQTKTLLAVNDRKTDTVYLPSQSANAIAETRKLNGTSSIPLPALHENQLKNKGTSLRDENSTYLLPEMTAFGR